MRLALDRLKFGLKVLLAIVVVVPVSLAAVLFTIPIVLWAATMDWRAQSGTTGG